MDSEPDHDKAQPPSPLAQEAARRRAAEAMLAESEARYRSLFDNASDGILLFDDAGVIFKANPKIRQMLGCRREDLLGRQMTDLIHPEDLQKVPSQLHRLRAGESVAIERRLRCKDGSYRNFEQSARRIGANVIMSLYRDITLRKQAEQETLEALKNAEESEGQLEEAICRVNTMAMDAEVAALEMDQIFNATSDGICVIDKDFRISKFNRILRTLMADLGITIDKGLCHGILAHELCGTERCLLERILKEDQDRIEEEIEIPSPDGRRRTLLVTAQPMMDLTADTVGVVESYKDITDRKEIERELRRLAVTDPLTGAFNRRQFMRRAREEIDRSRRYHTGLTLLMMDIDHFKAVNDTFGHDAGDQVLKGLVAESMKQLRTSDIFCRLGGEEFAAILTHTVPDQGRLAAERLRQALQALAVETAAGTVRFSVSIGVAAMLQDGLSLEEIMKKADNALYDAKQQGRNRVVLADSF
jgi:diguanylate cyclase (GGDEF)-like protein/PAS domain S-box-containing protein